ncbi:DUF4865 family protein [Kitasatospora sp. NPDC049285]|uniref:DUF4865 family protein n=1 Tax=Kitasatospora sp. NPDC049285 TaxID=3157096 RepID=UPI00341D2E1A
MHAKQYEITLPADYDLDVIRRRIAAGAPLLDDRPGLGFKAWLLRERGVDGSPVNQYAPFYLWQDAGAMAAFLVGGGGFHHIVRDFGRPAVGDWTPLGQYPGPARASAPGYATRALTPVPTDPDPLALAATVDRALDALRALAERPGVHTALLALDPGRWELLRFTLWQDAPTEDTGTVYRVPHLSAPGLADLPAGRTW